MHPTNLSQKSINHQRQEKLLAWIMTIVLHLVVIGGGIFWYLQQPSPTATTENATVIASIPIATSTPAPTPLQAEIDTTTVPAIISDTPATTAPPRTPGQAVGQSTKPSATLSNSAKTQVTQKTATATVPALADSNPDTPLHNDTAKNDFPVNGSTVTHTDTKITPTGYGTITTTTTNRITTVAPEINQALTDRDLPASERHVTAQQTSKNLSANAKKAAQLSKEIEKDNDANVQLIETVKRKNQARIDSDQVSAEK